MSIDPQPLEPADFALRCVASHGATGYLVYLATLSDASSVLADLEEELRAALADLVVVESASSLHLLHVLATQNEEATLLIDATAYGAGDWRLLDRGRSSFQRSGVTVLVTTRNSFDELMRNAPNLMSWLGGEVFAFPGFKAEERQGAGLCEKRLAALRNWSGLTDEQVVEEARNGTLPRDPEYAEWLVLLGRGDLLNA